MESFLFGWIRPLIFKEAILIGIEAYSRVREGFGVGWIEGWFRESSQVCSDGIFVGQLDLRGIFRKLIRFLKGSGE